MQDKEQDIIIPNPSEIPNGQLGKFTNINIDQSGNTVFISVTLETVIGKVSKKFKVDVNKFNQDCNYYLEYAVKQAHEKGYVCVLASTLKPIGFEDEQS